MNYSSCHCDLIQKVLEILLRRPTFPSSLPCQLLPLVSIPPHLLPLLSPSHDHVQTPPNLLPFNYPIPHLDLYPCLPEVLNELCVRLLIGPLGKCHHWYPACQALEGRVPATVCHEAADRWVGQDLHLGAPWHDHSLPFQFLLTYQLFIFYTIFSIFPDYLVEVFNKIVLGNQFS